MEEKEEVDNKEMWEEERKCEYGEDTFEEDEEDNEYYEE